MAIFEEVSQVGDVTSPGGFCFGVTNWRWPVQVPTSLTWYLDNTVSVFDQLGRPVRGVTLPDGRRVMFADRPPNADKSCAAMRPAGHNFCTHLQAVEALEAEGIQWQKLLSSGWPQINIDRLRTLPNLPDVPVEQLHQIKNESVRKDALLRRLEMDQVTDERKRREQAAVEAEYQDALARAKQAADAPGALATTTK